MRDWPYILFGIAVVSVILFTAFLVYERHKLGAYNCEERFGGEYTWGGCKYPVPEDQNVTVYVR